MGIEYSFYQLINNIDVQETITHPDGTIIKRKNPWIYGLSLVSCSFILAMYMDKGTEKVVFLEKHVLNVVKSYKK